MDKRFQIFVSSTYVDLARERENVINSLIKSGYIAVGMEQFPSTDEGQMDYINAVIDESDYYVVIIKGKYGSTNSEGVSYTECEYRYAVEKNIPCLAFLFGNRDSLFVGETDKDAAKLERLDAFIKHLEESKIVSYWNDDRELVEKVKDSIHNIVRRKPGVGYVRGDQVFDVRIINDRERLMSENEILRQEIIELKAYNASLDAQYQPIKELFGEIEIKYKYIRQPTYIFSENRLAVTAEHYPVIEGIIDISYDEVFLVICNILERQVNEEDIVFILINKISAVDYDEYYQDITSEEKTKLRQRLRLKFEEAGLIKVTPRISKDQNRYRTYDWELTRSGRSYLAYKIGIR